VIGRRETGRRAAFLAASAGCWLLFAATAASQDWPEWGRTPQHRGAASVVGQPLDAIRAVVVYDPFVEQKKAEHYGELWAHYAVPLIDEENVYMEFQSGFYSGFGGFVGRVWQLQCLRWSGSALETVWTFDSDWVPYTEFLTNWEPVFQPALAGDGVWIPGAAGSVYLVSKTTGTVILHAEPFGDADSLRCVAGGLAAGPDGSVIYNVVNLDPNDSSGTAWLVRVSPSGSVATAGYASLVPGAPASDDLCAGAFDSSQLPWPPSPDAVPASAPCGAQRPGVNVVPAIAPDGTIYTVSVAYGNDRYGYLVAVHPDLTPAWASSLRGRVADGCGVLLPKDDADDHCRSDARTGVDPATNDLPAGRVWDEGTASPVVLPDGSVLIGTASEYNYLRGHLFRFDAQGAFLGSYDFGWDVTPAVREHGGTWSVLIKDNHYGSNAGPGFYDVTSLDASLHPEWHFRSTNTESCARGEAGGITCVDDHPDGFEWCVNQPVVDANGTLYLNSEDGNLYELSADGRELGHIFLDTALGAAYTPVSMGPDGVVYAQNDGKLYAVGSSPTGRKPATRLPPRGHGTRSLPPR
jgi:outer membrane protein assembly factor BamB